MTTTTLPLPQGALIVLALLALAAADWIALALRDRGDRAGAVPPELRPALTLVAGV